MNWKFNCVTKINDTRTRRARELGNIGVFSIVIIVAVSIIAIIQVFDVGCDEDCFKEKFNAKEADAIFVKYEMYGRTTTSKYAYLVDNVRYNINITPIADSEQEGDKFVVLYDPINPKNAILLRNRPVLPDSLIETHAEITYISNDAKTKSVIVIFEYVIEGLKVKRLQYVPIQYLEMLTEKYKTKSKILIKVYTNNARRSYLVLSSL